MDRAVYPYITWMTGDEVGLGDVVSCRMESDDARFQRPAARITVGAGLLNKEEEGKLVGARVVSFCLDESGRLYCANQ